MIQFTTQFIVIKMSIDDDADDNVDDDDDFHRNDHDYGGRDDHDHDHDDLTCID